MTLKTVFGITALVASLAALPALAQSASASEAQLARSLGVEPGVYSLTQLVDLQALKAEGGSSARHRIANLLANRGEGDTATRADQLALGLGVEPGSLSVADLQALRQARRENDSARANFILSGGTHGGSTETARRQLAASLGVEAGDLSVEELIRLYSDRRNDEN